MRTGFQQMTDKEIIDYFAGPIILGEAIPEDIQFGFRRCLQLLSMAAISRVELTREGKLIQRRP